MIFTLPPFLSLLGLVLGAVVCGFGGYFLTALVAGFLWGTRAGEFVLALRWLFAVVGVVLGFIWLTVYL